MSKDYERRLYAAPRGTNGYCGPAAAVSILRATVPELTTGDVAKVIRDRTGQRAVRGTSSYDMRYVFEQFGYRLSVGTSLPLRDRPTLLRWADRRSIKSREFRFTLLMKVTFSGWDGHWIAVRGLRACDSYNRKPVCITKFKNRRKKVQAYYSVVYPY